MSGIGSAGLGQLTGNPFMSNQGIAQMANQAALQQQAALQASISQQQALVSHAYQQAYQQAAHQQPYDYAAVAQYLPAEDTRLFIRELAIRHISEKDAQAIIRIISEYISKDQRELILEEELETAILTWLIEKQS